MTDGGVATIVAAPAPPADVRADAARLERAAGMLLRRLRSTRPGDLTRSQSSLLVTVREHGPLSLADLARLEAVQAPTASRAVDLLVQRGLLRRDVDPGDHRRQLIDLEGDAADLLDQRSREAVTALAGALTGLEPSAREALVDALPVLDEVVTALGDEPAAPSGGR